MIFIRRRTFRFLPLIAGLAVFSATAQQPDDKRWAPVTDIPLLENEAGMWFAQDASMKLRGIDKGEPKSYPFTRFLISYRQAHHGGDLSPHRSRIELIVFDCANRRTQSLQSRIYALPDGRGSPTLIAGTLSAWAWNEAGGQSQDTRVSAAVLRRYCPAGG